MDTRPIVLTDAMIEFLDELQESGEMNMFGAGMELREIYGLTRDEARACVLWWMQSKTNQEN